MSDPMDVDNLEEVKAKAATSSSFELPWVRVTAPVITPVIAFFTSCEPRPFIKAA
jgi:hypothetical protein